MQKIHRFLLAALCLAVLSFTAGAHDVKSGDLLIGHPWARATAGHSANGAAYFTVANNGKEADRLVSAATPVAEMAELHTHRMEDGVMKMRPIDGLEIAPGTPIVLGPGGLHIMLMNIKAPLKEGDSFPLTLTFQKAGPVTVSVLVEGIAATHSEQEEHVGHEGHPMH